MLVQLVAATVNYCSILLLHIAQVLTCWDEKVLQTPVIHKHTQDAKIKLRFLIIIYIKLITRLALILKLIFYKNI